MNKTEWDELVDALTKDAGGAPPELLLKPQSRQPATIEELVESVAGRQAEAPPTSAAPVAKAKAGDATADNDIVKTIGKYSGISPVITGLFKLFGGGDDERDSGVGPIAYAMPRSVSVEAGLTQDREVRSISYGQQGGVRAANPAPSPAPVQITVQAIDSKSFLDHRDEIARAVREAMLNSHSLNDVVSEL